LLIDRTHKRWLVASVAILVVAVAVYVPYAIKAPQGAKGGSVLGITYGVVGFAFMIFAGLLGMRKKFPIWRIGRAQTWMRGHLWLGLISLPIIFLHAGFHFGSGLTRVLMWLFMIVVFSGLLGAILQHFMPRLLLSQVTMETIYEQIQHIREQLLVEADKLVADAAVPEISAAPAYATAGAPFEPIATAVEVDDRSVSELRHFYQGQMRPFIEHGGSRGEAMANGASARVAFQQLRVLLPPAMHSSVDDLENICEEKRQLDRQDRMHRLLHGWLLVHIPLSFALLLLGAIHAVEALRF
jgi:hypothetical protein